MASSEDQLASQLIRVGTKLLEIPPTFDMELLAVLDRLDIYLSRVEQSPSKEIQSALASAKKALVGDRLLRHENVDVLDEVASCLSEIMRITAPDVPYKEDEMKDVFQLIVSTFERLPDKFDRSYTKRISILETVAKVRSCVVMLDLECDELILEMFRHLIKALRDYHPENVFTSMKSIMTRVVDESEEISSDLLFCILESVKKDNMEVRPVARKMMETVIQTCADKLLPYIRTAVRTKELVLADYDEVLSYLCLETSAETAGQSEHTDDCVVKVLVDANKLLEPSPDAVQDAEDTPVIVIEGPPADGFSDLVIRNDNAEVEVDNLSVSSAMQDSNSSNPDMVPDTITAVQSAAFSNPEGVVVVETDTKASETTNPLALYDNLDAEEIVDETFNTGPLTENIGNKRGRNPKAGKKTPKSKMARKFTSAVKQVDELSGPHKSSKEPDRPSQGQESSNEAADHSSVKPSETDVVSSDQISGETGQSDKVDEFSKCKIVIRISENHKSAGGDLEERTTTNKVDDVEAKATAPQADNHVEKADAPSDENPMEDTMVLPRDAVPEGAAPLVDEPPEEVDSSVGKLPELLAVLSNDTHDVEERTATPTVDASEAKATASQTDMHVQKTDAPNDEHPKEDTIILPSDALPEGAAPLADEPLEVVESSVGKSPELAVLSKDIHDVDNDPSKTNNDIKSRGRGMRRAALRKHAIQGGAQNINKDANTSQKLVLVLALKSIVNEENLKETPKSSTKRKHIEEKKEECKDYGEELVGSKMKVWWPADRRYYKGVIKSFDSAKKKHKVLYADGEVEHLVLSRQHWEVINPSEDSDMESDEGTPDTASRKSHKDEEPNEGTSRKRLGRPTSSKAKSASNKHDGLVRSGRKSRGDFKGLGKAKEDNCKEEEKSELVSVSRRGRLPRTVVSKSAGKRNPTKAGSRERKAPAVNKDDTSGAKSGQKRKRGCR